MPVLSPRKRRFSGIALGAIALCLANSTLANAFEFTPGDLVIDTVTGSGLDSASPMTLQEFSLGGGGTSASPSGSLTLPQTGSGAISGEYGSASEGFLSQSVNSQYLTVIGYGVNATTFNTAPASTYGAPTPPSPGQTTNFALGQTTSLTPSEQTGTIYTTVPRVVALIGGNGGVNTSTQLTDVFNTNNPRSAVTVDGTSFYVSGQGASKTDPTQGVFLAQLGATTATTIDNSTDTRALAIYNNALYVSRDQNPPGGGSQNFTNVGRYDVTGGGLPTSSTDWNLTHIAPPASPLSSGGNNGSINLTAGTANGINNSRIGSFVYLSPEQYFFANPDTLYVADSGQPKNGNVNKAALGEGGLQKWSFNGSTWVLDYDLVAGLNLLNNANADANTPAAPGVTGLFGLTGEVVGGQVELFATSYGLNELSPSFLYEITDTLADTTIAQAASETFDTLYSAPTNISIRGVAFAPTGMDDPLTPTPLPASWTFMLIGLAGLGWAAMRRRPNAQVWPPPDRHLDQAVIRPRSMMFECDGWVSASRQAY
jgi:hypothetical protein